MVAELADQADHLSELLGDDHDLAVLQQMLADEPDRFADAATRELLAALIEHRRGELQHEAMLLGPRLFLDRPKAFARRLEGYWHLWRAEGEPQPSNEPLAAHV